MGGRHGTLILCYHRIAEGVADPFGLCVRPDTFATHLEEIARTMEPSTLDGLDRPSRRRRVVVTFDDGYRDNLCHAVPVAEAAGVPITVFVTSGMVGRRRGFWWDLLASLLCARPPGTDEIRLSLGNDQVTVPVGQGRFRSDLGRVHRALLPFPVPEIERELDTLAQQWSVTPETPPDARALSKEELGRLAASPVVTIGAHTLDHVHLSSRPTDEQLDTIAGSKRELEEMLRRPVSHFAYPFGGHDDFDDHSVAAVTTAGFETACTTVPGSVRPSSDRFRLPRRIVLDWGRTRFQGPIAALEGAVRSTAGSPTPIATRPSGA